MKEPRIHELKVWPVYFQAVLDGEKTFEFRRNDRGYQKGDGLALKEYDYDRDAFTDRSLITSITYVMGGKGPFPDAHDLSDWVILGIEVPGR